MVAKVGNLRLQTHKTSVTPSPIRETFSDGDRDEYTGGPLSNGDRNECLTARKLSSSIGFCRKS